MAAQAKQDRPYSSSGPYSSEGVVALGDWYWQYFLDDPHLHLNLHPGKMMLLAFRSPLNGFTSCSRYFDMLARSPFRTKRLTPPETGRVLVTQLSQYLIKPFSAGENCHPEVPPPSWVSLILISEAAFQRTQPVTN